MILACKSETFRSLYSYALLIFGESSKCKVEVLHENQFKDPLTSTCQLSSVG